MSCHEGLSTGIRRRNSGSDGQERPSVAVSYEYTRGLPALLECLELSVLLSTYQAGRVVSVGSHRGKLRLGFSRFDPAIGLTRTASGIAVDSRGAIWPLPVSREIALRIKPEDEHDTHPWPAAASIATR